MLFMVIERFQDNDMIPVYERFRDRGRGTGVTFEFFPVVPSARTREVVASHLGQP